MYTDTDTDKEVAQWKQTIKDIRERTIKEGLKDFPEFFNMYPYSYHNALYSYLKWDIMTCDPWYTRKRAKKVLKKVKWYDSFEFTLLYQVTKRDRNRKYLVELFKGIQECEDDPNFYNNRFTRIEHRNYWEKVFTYIFDNDAYWQVLLDFLLWKAIMKYYDGVEADEGTIRQVKDMLGLIVLMRYSGNPIECADYFSRRYLGWWD